MKNKKLRICAPVSGKLVDLEQVNDPIFSQKMMGEGIAIIPENGIIVSPIDGEISMVAPTKHAYGLKGGKWRRSSHSCRVRNSDLKWGRI